MKTQSNDSDFGLVNQIKRGDTSAFRFLVDKYKDVSFSLACSILKNEHDAEDALQESFIKVYSGIKRFRFQSTFSTWLYKIVVNTCNTKLKSLQRQRKIVKIDSYNDFVIYDNGSEFNKLVSKERTKIINHALKSMKSEESLLLRLYYLAELDIREIIKITGFKESKIKVTLYRARKSLYTELQKTFDNELILL